MPKNKSYIYKIMNSSKNISTDKIDKLKQFLEQNNISLDQLNLLAGNDSSSMNVAVNLNSNDNDDTNNILDTLESEDLDNNTGNNDNDGLDELMEFSDDDTKNDNNIIDPVVLPSLINNINKNVDDELDLISDSDDALMYPIINTIYNQQHQIPRSLPYPETGRLSSPAMMETLESNVMQPTTNQISNNQKNATTNQISNNPKNAINETLSNNQKPVINETLSNNQKITINVGGKKFNLKKNILKHLNINYGRLQKIAKNDGRMIYFLDRDPYYFSKIMSIIKMFGFDEDKILAHINDYSEQLLSELCIYGLIDKKNNPKPKLKLTQTVTLPSRHDDIVKIIVGEQLFETGSNILSKSTYFDVKIKLSKTKQFHLTDIDPKLFRYVLNFLRTGELYINNDDVIELLLRYGIEYETTTNNKIDENIVSHYLPNKLDAINNQLIGCANIFDPKTSPNSNPMHQFIDNRYYYPSSMLASPNVENFNTITTDDKLLFGTDIIFNLTDTTKDLGECIEDLLLCIDIPVLKNDERGVEYVDNIEYQLVESIDIISATNTNKKLMLHTDNNLLYLHPIIYTNNAQDYHEMTKIGDKKMKLLYDNTLIDIHRIILPLFLFSDGQTHLPVRKMLTNKNYAFLVVKMAPIEKLFKARAKDIPLLNISLLSNYINLASSISVYDDQHGPDGNPNQIAKKPQISKIPINVELKDHPMMYLYDKTYCVSVPIQNIDNPIYDVAIIPLDKFGFIKDFFFTIIEEEDLITNKIDNFMDALIEIEILQTQTEVESKQKTLIVHSKLDSSMLNYYIPLKRLGHKLPLGIYYNSFSANPKCNQILGGLLGLGYIIRFKVKKMEGAIKFYVNEYSKEIL